jgi:hypothetical protein
MCLVCVIVCVVLRGGVRRTRFILLCAGVRVRVCVRECVCVCLHVCERGGAGYTCVGKPSLFLFASVRTCARTCVLESVYVFGILWV